MIPESTIRNLLATKLDLLEVGLVHIDTEHKLLNPLYGSKGSIDILARDSVGHRVIIELKRSNASARSAIHELCKYIALFKAQHGLQGHRLRCFLVSTDWHELLMPFAELVRASDFQIDGFELTVSQDGTPISATKVALPSATEPVKFFIHHDIFLYEDADRRNEAAAGIADQLLASGATAALVCRLDSSKSLDQKPYRYALYSVVGGIEPEVQSQIESDLRIEYETEDLESVGNILSPHFREARLDA